jgi:hypothetical protein
MRMQLKLQVLGVSDSQLKWQKAYDAWSTRTNGTIYKDHPMIAKSRLLYAYIALGDLESMRALYADNAVIQRCNEYYRFERHSKS